MERVGAAGQHGDQGDEGGAGVGEIPGSTMRRDGVNSRPFMAYVQKYYLDCLKRRRRR